MASATCPISMEPIPEGARFEVDGTAFDVRSVLDMVLVQGSMAVHPYTRQPLPAEVFARLHSSAMAFPETRALLLSRSLGAWPEFARRMAELGGRNQQELMQSSLAQAFETAWSRIFDALLESGADWQERLLRLCREEIVDLVLNTVRLQGHADARRNVVALIDRRCESTTCIESLQRLHRLAVVVVAVMDSLAAQLGAGAGGGGGGGIVVAYDVVEDAEQVEEEEQAAGEEEEEQQHHSHEGEDDGEEEEGPSSPRLPPASDVQRLLALGQRIFGGGIFLGGGGSGGVVLGDVVERAPPAHMLLPSTSPLTSTSSAATASHADLAAAAGPSVPASQSVTTLPAVQWRSSLPSFSLSPVPVTMGLTGDEGSGSGHGSPPSPAAAAAAAGAAEEAGAAQSAEAATTAPLATALAFGSAAHPSPEPSLPETLLHSTISAEWMLHVVDLMLTPDIAHLNMPGRAFVTASWRRRVGDTARRWGGPEASARAAMLATIDEVQRETGQTSPNLELLREILRGGQDGRASELS
jgi:hypothetical protein